jgi:hypothetical protein
MKIYVLTWAYLNSDKSWIIAAYNNEIVAKDFLKLMQNQGDKSKRYSLVETTLL